MENTKFAGKEYDGFYIIVHADRRFYQDDDKTEHITATLRSSNQVLLKIPSWDYDLLNSRDEIAKMGVSKQGLLAAVDNSHTNGHDSGARKYKYLLLNFKSPVVLSAECIHPGIEDTQQLPLKGNLKFRGGRTHVYFTVARTDTESFKRGKHEKKQHRSVGAALFDSPQKDEDDDDDDMLG